MVINSFTMQSGTPLAPGQSSTNNWRTLVHADTYYDKDLNKWLHYYNNGKISAACFINEPYIVTGLQNTVNSWGLENYVPYNARVIVRNRSFMKPWKYQMGEMR